jgi:hypothetical protein
MGTMQDFQANYYKVFTSFAGELHRARGIIAKFSERTLTTEDTVKQQGGIAFL